MQARVIPMSSVTLRTHMEEIAVQPTVKVKGKTKKASVQYFLKVHAFVIKDLPIKMQAMIKEKHAELQRKYLGIQDPLRQDGHPIYDGDKKLLLCGNGHMATMLKQAGVPYKGTILYPSVI